MMISNIKSVVKYLKQAGPKADKHRTWTHCISACVLHYIISTSIVISLYDTIYWPYDPHSIDIVHVEQRQKSISVFLAIYFLSLCVYRLGLNNDNPIEQKAVIYEMTWLCNQTLIMAAICITTGREVLAMAYVITVSIDQILWYVDLFGYLWFGTFPVGVAKYLTWENTTLASRVTCTHHIWTIPLVIYACCGIKATAFPLSAVVMTLNVILSRFFTPFTIQYKNVYERKSCEKYLNVNLSHELWRDITFSWLQIQSDDPSVHVYLFRLLWRWQVLNGIIFFLVLQPLSAMFFGS